MMIKYHLSTAWLQPICENIIANCSGFVSYAFCKAVDGKSPTRHLHWELKSSAALDDPAYIKIKDHFVESYVDMREKHQMLHRRTYDKISGKVADDAAGTPEFTRDPFAWGNYACFVEFESLDPLELQKAKGKEYIGEVSKLAGWRRSRFLELADTLHLAVDTAPEHLEKEVAKVLILHEFEIEGDLTSAALEMIIKVVTEGVPEGEVRVFKKLKGYNHN